MIRWITKGLGTAPWGAARADDLMTVIDVRALRDSAGNSAECIRNSISHAVDSIRHGRRVVLCCDHGISRSNAIAAAVLSIVMDVDYGVALSEVITATGERGIKVDFAAEVCEAIGRSKRESAGLCGAAVLGSRSLVGKAVAAGLQCVTRVYTFDAEDDLICTPALLDCELHKIGASTVYFAWEPPAADTNEGIGAVIVRLRNVLEVCRVRGAKLVYFSGVTVFSGYCAEPIRAYEDTPPHPASAVGDAMLLCETLIDTFCKRHGLVSLVVRPAHVYGTGDNNPGFLRTFIAKALRGEIIETHIYDNGSPEVDLLHVRDLVNAVSRAHVADLRGTLHLACGKSMRTDDLAHLIVHICRSNSEVGQVELHSRSPRVTLDASKARRLLQWAPTTSVLDGLAEMIDDERAKCARYGDTQ